MVDLTPQGHEAVRAMKEAAAEVSARTLEPLSPRGSRIFLDPPAQAWVTAMGGGAMQLLKGDRLHLSHGPIDVAPKARGASAAVEAAYRAAVARFPAILPELCAELPTLRRPVTEPGPAPASPVGRRMAVAAAPFAGVYITPMAAVAGAVADELLAAMRGAAGISSAWVNDGGDIAVWCAPGERLDIGLAGWEDKAGDDTLPAHLSARTGAAEPEGLPALPARLTVRSGDGVGGIATSGARGRSFSLGIADAVTVLAATAAAADAAATIIANAVDADHPGIVRQPACALDPDSDLRDLAVTVCVPRLPAMFVDEALRRGLARAAALRASGSLSSMPRCPCRAGISSLATPSASPRLRPSRAGTFPSPELRHDRFRPQDRHRGRGDPPRFRSAARQALAQGLGGGRDPPNPYAGRYEPDILPMMEARSRWGSSARAGCWMRWAARRTLSRPMARASLVGADGEVEHGALWHVPGGYAMREMLGKALAIVPSSAKVGPLGRLHRHSAASPQRRLCAQPFRRDHRDRAGRAACRARLMFVLAMSSGSRPHARVGGLAAKDISVWDGQR